MKKLTHFVTSLQKPRLIGAFCASIFCFSAASSHAALQMIIDTYTADEVSFTLSGTFDADTIGIFPGYLAVKNDWSNNTGVHTDWFTSIPTISVNTVQIGGLAPTLTEAQNSPIRPWNDNIFFRFDDNLAPFTAGTTVSGSITLSGAGIFDPADKATLELVSGLNFTEPFSDDDDWARLEATATMSPVPVPAAAWLFGSALIGLAGLARRK